MIEAVLVLRDGDSRYRLSVTRRDWFLLLGPTLPEGREFIRAFGVFEHFTVIGGIPPDSTVKRNGRDLLAATESLLTAVQRDAELLKYDYSYGFEGNPTRHSGKQSIQVNGLFGTISTRPKGFCTIELSRPGIKSSTPDVELIDLRIPMGIQTDNAGYLKCYKRKAPISWLDTLPPMLDFLNPRQDIELSVQHHE